MDTISL